MTEEAIEKLKYPNGKFSIPEEVSPPELEELIEVISTFPKKMELLVAGITDAQKLKTYRPESWTVQQVVHHCADSHVNAYIRFRWTLTEDNPTIKAYDENTWSHLPDANQPDLTDSLILIHGVHRRWTKLLRCLTLENFSRTFYHPESKMTYRLDQALANYAWHCEHHLAHVAQALASEDVKEESSVQ